MKIYEIAKQPSLFGDYYLTAKDVAAVFGCSRQTVYKWIRLGAPVIETKQGKRSLYLFELERLRTWLLESLAAASLRAYKKGAEISLDDAPSLIYSKVEKRRRVL